MVILGIADGVDAGAALVVDDRLVAVSNQECHDRRIRSRSFPWASIDEVLEQAGLRNRHVDALAISGRFTPSLAVRRRPDLVEWGRDPFSLVHDANVAVQSVLRKTGLGAAEADRASEWLERRFVAKGFNPTRVVMVDTHRALAEAAYRSQPSDLLLVMTLHPRGDGVFFAVHVGRSGQLDRIEDQRGPRGLHLHVDRCASAIGLQPTRDEAQLWSLAGRAEPDPHLVALLAGEFSAHKGQFRGRGLSQPASRTDQTHRALTQAQPAVAAASVHRNLANAVCEIVRHYVRKTGISRVAVGGSLFENPRLVAEVAALDQVASLWAFPDAGHKSLAVGAAACFGALAPHEMSEGGLGREHADKDCQRALSVAKLRGSPVEVSALVRVLEDGGAVARFQGRAGFGPGAGATRCVLVRADDNDAVAAVRGALGRSSAEEIGCARLSDRPALPRSRRVSPEFAARHASVTADDGLIMELPVSETADPLLFEVLTRADGVDALAVFPLAEADQPPVAVLGEAIRTWSKHGFQALMLGSFWVAK